MTTDTVEGVQPEQPITQQVTALLEKHGHPRPTDWLQGLHPDVFTSPDVGIQRFLINRYWRVQLGNVQENTLDERYCLVDTGEIKDWLRLFDEGVAACIVRHNLPPAVH